MSRESLIVERFEDVVRFTLNRPDAMNALNLSMVEAFERALSAVEADYSIRALIVTGAGSAFCAGADLKDAVSPQTEPNKPDFLERASLIFGRIRDLPIPVIAALNGITLAGGLELAMCADIVVAADSIKVGDAHANFGAYPGAGGAAVLPRRIPLQMALYGERKVKGVMGTLCARLSSLLCYPGLSPICVTRPVSRHDQPYIRSPFATAAP